MSVAKQGSCGLVYPVSIAKQQTSSNSLCIRGSKSLLAEQAFLEQLESLCSQQSFVLSDVT